MQYVMSDIRGDFDAYERMLEKISFSEKDDVLYLAGNIAGAGGDSLKLILDLSVRANVYPVWGGEDLRAARFLRLLGEKAEEKNLASLSDGERKEFAQWLSEGGSAVLEEFQMLAEEDRSFVLEYFDEFEPFIITKAGKRVFVILHGGFRSFEEGKDLSAYPAEELATGTVEAEKRYFPGAYLITGTECPEDKVVKTAAGNLLIDCGLGRGGRLACLSLDSGKVFYTE